MKYNLELNFTDYDIETIFVSEKGERHKMAGFLYSDDCENWDILTEKEKDFIIEGFASLIEKEKDILKGIIGEHIRKEWEKISNDDHELDLLDVEIYK
jgi:hypothetical protein